MSERSTTRRSSKKPRSVRVWGEVGITMAVTQQPPQFVKVTFGHERIAPDDSVATLVRTRRLIRKFNEEAVEEEVEKLRRLVLSTSEADEDTSTRSRKRRSRS